MDFSEVVSSHILNAASVYRRLISDGLLGNTVYINSSSIRDFINELASLFADEGMVLLPHSKERVRQCYEPMQYATALKNNLWGVAVFPGCENWVVVKTAPLELLYSQTRVICTAFSLFY